MVQAVTMGEISNNSGSPKGFSPERVQNPIGLPPKAAIQNNNRANRYQVQEEEEIMNENDIDFDLIENEIDNKNQT